MSECAEAINSLIAAVEAIERELGLTPRTIYANVRARIDILEARINNPNAPAPDVENPFYIGDSGVSLSVGSGFPTEDRLPGSLYLRTDGYSGQLYSRENDAAWRLIPSIKLNTNISINFGTVSATSTATQTVSVSGAQIGENVIVNPRATLNSSIQIDYCRVSATNTIEIRIYNRSGGGIVVNQAFDITVVSS